MFSCPRAPHERGESPRPLAGGVVTDFQLVLVNSFVLPPLVREPERSRGEGAC